MVGKKSSVKEKRMLLLNPKNLDLRQFDKRFQEIVQKTIDFFEGKGLKKIKDDDHQRIWYSDFLEFIKKEEIFATLLTPAGDGNKHARRDTWRIAHYNEILVFYGLAYWYTWQVTILGLGPIWMSGNGRLKERAAHCSERERCLLLVCQKRSMGLIFIRTR